MAAMDKWQKADAARAGPKSTRNEKRIAEIRARMFGKKDEKPVAKPTPRRKAVSPAEGARAASGGGSMTKPAAKKTGRGNGAAEVAKRKEDAARAKTPGKGNPSGRTTYKAKEAAKGPTKRYAKGKPKPAPKPEKPKRPGRGGVDTNTPDVKGKGGKAKYQVSNATKRQKEISKPTIEAKQYKRRGRNTTVTFGGKNK